MVLNLSTNSVDSGDKSIDDVAPHSHFTAFRYKPSTAPVSATWRPTYHCMAVNGWINDPCGPGYNPVTKLYHLSFQWNPNDNIWGDICWGQATSPDLVSWDVSKIPSLQPSEHYDRCAVFTGCFQPTSITGEGDGTLTQLYTSVSRIPIHHTIPYHNGCETLSIASSRDGGNTWKKSDQNPILPGPPTGLSVTGFRDPFMSTWPSLAESKKAPKQQIYGILSGGIKNSSPSAFVYSVDPKNLASWEYVGLIAQVGLNYSPSHWTGDFGRNWEVVNMVSLEDSALSKAQDFLIMGVEGAIPQPKKGMSLNEHTTETRTSRLHLWMAGTVAAGRTDPADPLMDYEYGGYFDHGCLYASNSFWDPVTERNIVFGWIQEDDHSKSLAEAQGWQGVISLPRVLTLQTTHHVAHAHKTPLSEITSVQCKVDENGTFSVSTLGISPDSRTEKLRSGAQYHNISNRQLREASDNLSQVSLDSMTWELECNIAVGKTTSRVGFNIYHGSDQNTPEKTVMFFDSANETFVIERNKPSLVDPKINIATEVAPHTLFTIADPVTGEQAEESLHVRVFWDMSVVEVFINGRTAISTRIYVAKEGGTTIAFFADATTNNETSDAILNDASIWDGLKSSRC